MWSGSKRFNEIRRGVPGMSPTLMSKRLREMEERGLVSRMESTSTGEIKPSDLNLNGPLWANSGQLVSRDMAVVPTGS